MSNRLGKDDPAGQGDQHHDLALLQAAGNFVPEGNGQGFDNGSDPTQKSRLSGVHANLFEVNTHQGEKGAKGGVEEKVKALGHRQTGLGRVWETAGEEGGAALGLLVLAGIHSIVFVITGLFPIGQTFGSNVRVAHGLRLGPWNFGGHATLGSGKNCPSSPPCIKVFVGDGHDLPWPCSRDCKGLWFWPYTLLAAAAALEAVLNSIEPEYCLGYFGWSLVLILEPLKIHYFPLDREGESSFQAFST